MAEQHNFLDNIQAVSFQILKRLDSLARRASLNTAPDLTNFDASRPITAAKRSLKPFIIGFVPPDIPLSFKPFERVQSEFVLPPRAGFPITQKPPKPPGPLVEVPPTKSKVATGEGGERRKKRTKISTKQMREALTSAWIDRYGSPPSNSTMNILLAQAALETGEGQLMDNFNFGNIHAGRSSKDLDVAPPPPANPHIKYYDGIDFDGTGRKYRVTFEAYDSAEEGARRYIDKLHDRWPQAIGPLLNGDTDAYLAALVSNPKAKYFEASPERYGRGVKARIKQYEKTFPPDVNNQVTNQNNPRKLSVDDFSKRTLRNAINAVGAAFAPGRVGVMTSQNVTDDDDAVTQISGRNIQLTNDFRAQQIADQINELQTQIQFIKEMPPLLFLINPQEFVRNYEQTYDDSVKTRNGHVVHMWLEKPLNISCKGVSAAQYVVTSGLGDRPPDSGSPNATGVTGLDTHLRLKSLSYQNLMSLVLIYKNNGILIQNGTNQAGIGIFAFSVFIYYDDHIYLGSFDDFSLSESSEKPFNFEYNFKFTVRYDFDVAPFTDLSISQGIFNATNDNPFAPDRIPISFNPQVNPNPRG
jgi:hypothetical protein